jgi:hypothetical protein
MGFEWQFYAGMLIYGVQKKGKGLPNWHREDKNIKI